MDSTIANVETEHEQFDVPVYFLNVDRMREWYRSDYALTRPIVSPGLLRYKKQSMLYVVDELTVKDWRLFDGTPLPEWKGETDWHKLPKDYTIEMLYGDLLMKHLTYSDWRNKAECDYTDALTNYSTLIRAYNDGLLEVQPFTYTISYELDSKRKSYRYTKETHSRRYEYAVDFNDCGTDPQRLYNDGLALIAQWEQERADEFQLGIEITIAEILMRVPEEHRAKCNSLLHMQQFAPGYGVRFYQGQLLFREFDRGDWRVLYDTNEGEEKE